MTSFTPPPSPQLRPSLPNLQPFIVIMKLYEDFTFLNVTKIARFLVPARELGVEGKGCIRKTEILVILAFVNIEKTIERETITSFTLQNKELLRLITEI